jgi:hypothetical protein
MNSESLNLEMVQKYKVKIVFLLFSHFTELLLVLIEVQLSTRLLYLETR